MTDLTDKWKKGELPSGTYWLKTACTRFPEVGYYVGIDGKVDFYKKSDGFRTKNVLAVEKVLSKVPSYEEWQAKLEENTKLKELLKQARESVYVERANDNSLGDTIWNYTTKLINEINQALGEDE